MHNLKNNSFLSASLLFSILLAGCGGGGSSDNSPKATTASPASDAASPASDAASSPIATSLPSAASAPSAASTPPVAGEALPSLTSPQPGSTAVTGTGPVGIWTSSGVAHTIAFVDPQNNISALNATGTVVLDEFFGVLATTASSWSLTSGTDFTALVFAYPTTSGSGTYVLGQTFTGSYVANSKTTNLSWTYDAANALSVTQQSVAGTWAQSGTSLVIASDGSLTGTLSGCNVSGTTLLTTPGTSQNLYTMTVSAAAAAGSCAMPAGLTYSGSAAILFLPSTGSNGYKRTIAYALKASDNLHIAYGQLQKQ